MYVLILLYETEGEERNFQVQGSVICFISCLCVMKYSISLFTVDFLSSFLSDHLFGKYVLHDSVSGAKNVGGLP